ncbi:MAG: twin-arginine translocation signal domain-containing protein [Desulfobacterales bacterium]
MNRRQFIKRSTMACAALNIFRLILMGISCLAERLTLVQTLSLLFPEGPL